MQTAVHVQTQPNDKTANIAARRFRQECIYAFGCYSPDLRFTLADVWHGFRFGMTKAQAFQSISDLMVQKRVRRTGNVVDRSIQYEIITTKEDLCQ